eukprot:NODE_3072_length_2097_cov_7.393401.p1 GENE.NODE_3072_length_2097_cov_7.393401~~NODE_3072_length_2097_cov_7.393401.p1  ORF type:complete len:546 (+),score=221.75 NODE_3072_length_2097_cov_7.393401:175-1812(+)
MPVHLRYGYVAQEMAPLRGDATALEVAMAADEERVAMLAERTELSEALTEAHEFSNGSERAAAEAKARRLEEVERRLEAIDADGAEGRARAVLGELDFDEAMLQQRASILSGGWRMRLGLAQALCGRPDVLLLDEPTNHLDLHGVFWLQEHLRREWGSAATLKDRIVVVVSHDRAFMDACTTDILEIHSVKLRCFPGNYTTFLARIAEEQRVIGIHQEEEERQEKLARKDIRDMKKKAREHGDDKKIRQVKSKEKKADQQRRQRGEDHTFRLSSKRDDRVDDLIAKLREDSSLRFRFPEIEYMPDANLLEIDGACVKNSGKVILRDLTLTLEATSRVAIVGGNGSGKSTLMRALAGDLKLEEGSRGRGRTHAAYAPGFVSQNHLEHQAQHLHSNAVDFLRTLLPDESTVRSANMTKQTDDTVLRAHLGNFGLGQDAIKKVGCLSGGQKARLSLAAVTCQCPSVLLLDEPTNHLDIDSLDALSLGLQAFEGAVVVVSHSRGFLEALCDELWIVRGGTVKACPRGEDAFSEYFAEYARSVARSVAKA